MPDTGFASNDEAATSLALETGTSLRTELTESLAKSDILLTHRNMLTTRRLQGLPYRPFLCKVVCLFFVCGFSWLTLSDAENSCREKMFAQLKGTRVVLHALVFYLKYSTLKKICNSVKHCDATQHEEPNWGCLNKDLN